MCRNKLYFTYLALVFTLILVGCIASAPTTTTVPPNPTATAEPVESPTPLPTATPSAPTRLNLALGILPEAIDPHRTSDIFAADVLRYVCQGLTYLGKEPLLADSWEYAPDHLSITFELRKGVVFRDGTPFTSEAVRYSFARLQQPEAEEAGSPLYKTLEGVQIETPDTYTVIFRFDTPRSDFVDFLNSGYAAIISPLSDESTIAQDPICTGPYYVKSWVPGEYILFAKNELYASAPAYYENQGPSYIDEIKLHLIETHEDRFKALLEGNLDANHINTKEELEQIRERSDDFEIRRGHWLGGITYLGFNCARWPTDELKVRQAFAQAIDKSMLIDAVLADEFAIPAVSLFSPRMRGYSDQLKEVEYQFDLDQSRQRLAEVGFEDSNGDGFLEYEGEPFQLMLQTTTDNIYLDMATVIQELFAQIGVRVEISQATRAEISRITPTGEFDLLLYDYSWPHPSALKLFLHSERIGSTNRVAYSNPDVDQLLDEIAALEEAGIDDERLDEKLIEAQQMIIQDAPWQPILARRVVSAVNARVVGEKMHPVGALLWHDARIVEK